ncbi:MAG: hypothetical protein ABR511_11040 [Acidimicrobiales bacterium]
MSTEDRNDEEHARRLEALESRIRELERRLDGHHHGAGGAEYYESGSVHPELDDQAITP